MLEIRFKDYLDGRTRYVTVAGNLRSGIPYGTKICIEKLNERFGKQISLQVCKIIILVTFLTKECQTLHNIFI